MSEAPNLVNILAEKFEGTHPESIINSYELLNQRFKKELQNYVDDPK